MTPLECRGRWSIPVQTTMDRPWALATLLHTPPSASLIPMQRRWSIQTTLSVVMDGGIGRITGNPGQHCDNVTEAFRSALKELVGKYLWIKGLRSHRR